MTRFTVAAASAAAVLFGSFGVGLAAERFGSGCPQFGERAQLAKTRADPLPLNLLWEESAVATL